MHDTNSVKSPQKDQIILHPIAEAIEDIAQGKIIIVVDDEDRENEGDFVLAAEKTTADHINFMSIHGRGLHCVPLPERRCDELKLHPMVGNNTDPKGTAFTVSVDLLGHGVTTGISAADRAKTILAIMDEKTTPEQLGRPGHVFPLRAKKGGVLRRPGHTEAAVDLSVLAGLKPGGVIVEIMNDDGTMARLPQLMKIAQKHDLKIISIQDLIAYRLQNESLIRRIDSFPVKTIFGEFEMIAYEQTTNRQIHFVLKLGEWTAGEAVPVRVKSSNTYYDLFNSLQKGENPQLQKVSDILHTHGKGCIVFINNITNNEMVLEKLRNFKEMSVSESLNPIAMDEKDYGIGAQIIHDLGISKLQLITQKPSVKRNLTGYGLEISDYIQL